MNHPTPDIIVTLKGSSIVDVAVSNPGLIVAIEQLETGKTTVYGVAEANGVPEIKGGLLMGTGNYETP